VQSSAKVFVLRDPWYGQTRVGGRQFESQSSSRSGRSVKEKVGRVFWFDQDFFFWKTAG
jgi:hypothetical protein